MTLALKSFRVVAAILPSFPEYRRHILRLRNTILVAEEKFSPEPEGDGRSLPEKNLTF